MNIALTMRYFLQKKKKHTHTQNIIGNKEVSNNPLKISNYFSNYFSPLVISVLASKLFQIKNM